jgi:hypothetical protein
MPNIQPKIGFFLTGDLSLEIEITRIKRRISELFLMTCDGNFEELCGTV